MAVKRRAASAWNRKGRPQCVEVTWIDAAGKASWHTVEDALKEECATAVSVGFLIQRTRKKLTLVASLAMEDGEVTEVGDVTVIPAGWVTRMVVLAEVAASA